MADSRVLKFIRDPIHDIIRIQKKHRFILELLDSSPMQRLRRVGQLGLAWLVYPGAEHSRFTHSLGVFHLAGRAMDQLEEEAGKELFGEGQREAVLAAGLLHDIGHGPFSHVFEHVVHTLHPLAGMHHEAWTVRIVREHNEINKALANISANLPEKVCEIINHTYKPHYVTALISSQLDVDRFDYLLRDSYMTGTRYGSFDLEWMLRSLAVRHVPTAVAENSGATAQLETIVIDGQRGLSGLEAYIIGRHYMYKHVYFHHTIRSAEQMLRVILKRAAELIRDGNNELANSAFRKMARGEVLQVDEYLTLNDYALMSWIQNWSQGDEDAILRDLCNRLVNRRLLKAVVVPLNVKHSVFANNREKLQYAVSKKGFDSEYYLLEDEVDDIAYKNYLYNLEKGKAADEEEIWFVDSQGNGHRLSANPGIITEAAKALRFQEDRWFVPEEVVNEFAGTLKWS